MSRVEQYREKRKIRSMYTAAVLIFVVLLIPGLVIADYSFNSIYLDKKGIDLVELRNREGRHIEVEFLNWSFEIDTTYLQRDYKRIMDAISGKK